MVVFGVLSLLAGVVTVLGDDPGMGVAMLAFGGAVVAIGVIRPAPEGEMGEAEPGSVTLRDGRALRGTWLVASKRRTVTATGGRTCRRTAPATSSTEMRSMQFGTKSQVFL